MEKLLTSPVHYTVHESPISKYGSASDPPSPPHDSSAEIVTPRENTKPRDNPPNPVRNISADPDSDPTLSDYSSSESCDSSDNKYYKRRRRERKDRKKFRSKTRFDDLIKKCVNLTSKLLTYAYN